MDQWAAHDHVPGADRIERRACQAVWKCGRRFHQMSRPFDCFIGVPLGAVALMCGEDAETYPGPEFLGVPIEVCSDVPASHVWIRT